MRLNGLKSTPPGKRFLAFTLLSVFCLASSAANAQALDQLSASDQADIAQKCLPVQYQQGANAYRECVVAEVEKLSEQGNSETASLSFDEQYAIQQTCGPIANPTESAYQQCVNQEIASLSGEPATQMDSLDDDEIYALQQSCFDTQSTQGVKAYRQCMNAAMLSLQALPTPDLSQLTLLERNALQLRCSAQQTTAADYRSCLLDQVGASAAELPNAAVAPALNDVNTDSLATTDAQSELPAINVETFEPNTDTSADTNTGTTAATAADASITQTTDATSIAIAPSASDTLSDIPVTAPVVPETETTTNTTVNPPTGVNTQTLDSLTAPVTDAVEENSAINTSTTVQAVDIAKPIEPSDNTAIELAQEDSANLSAVNSISESVPPADLQSGLTEPSSTAQTTEQSASVDGQTLEGEQSQIATGIALVTTKTKEIWAQLQQSVSALDGTSRVIIAAAMAL
ncbi:MAG: hypothetical protein AB8B79_23010, partial [Granulosicoccus sp.]